MKITAKEKIRAWLECSLCSQNEVAAAAQQQTSGRKLVFQSPVSTSL
jgi:hypothetical protein